ncbi:MAG TPA: tagaturonate reductase [Clostridiales bacterium]|nr:tagaturonate reductase [Clostridiales bacterium]
MIKILQYGEGNFLRTFAEHYFDTLCEEGREYSVTIVKPIAHGSLEPFKRQGCRYHIVLRGMEEGKPVERVREIRVVHAAISPYEEYDAYMAAVLDPELRILVSNTTEAGIVFSAEDMFDGFEGITYPAKLTKLLYARYEAGLPGLYLLPVELIDNNADALKYCVDRYIDLWHLPEAFRAYNERENVYCNTLVDRIVSGHPKTPEECAHLDALIGEHDELASVGEPFGLWAIEKKGKIADLIPEGHHGIDVILTNDIAHYKKQKVRVLNGSHTNLVAAGMVEGAETVYDCMKDERLSAFVRETMDLEILPFVSEDRASVRKFADAVLARFENPYLNHMLSSIALNSMSKWRARVLPSVLDYTAANGRCPVHLATGFAYLLFLYSKVRAEGDRFMVSLKSGDTELRDDKETLAYFAAGGSPVAFMSREDVFGMDLTTIPGFADAVSEKLANLNV